MTGCWCAACVAQASRFGLLRALKLSRAPKTVCACCCVCSLANARDVGEWLGASGHATFNFAPGVRPVPLEIHMHGLDIHNFEARMQVGTSVLIHVPFVRLVRAFIAPFRLHATWLSTVWHCLCMWYFAALCSYLMLHVRLTMSSFLLLCPTGYDASLLLSHLDACWRRQACHCVCAHPQARTPHSTGPADVCSSRWQPAQVGPAVMPSTAALHPADCTVCLLLAVWFGCAGQLMPVPARCCAALC